MVVQSSLPRWLALAAGCALTACSTPAPPTVPPPDEADLPDLASRPNPDPAIKPPVLTSPNRGPRIKRVVIEPSQPTVKDILRARIEVIDPDNSSVDTDCVWYVNDEVVLGFTNEELPAGKVRPGDKVRVHVIADDGEAQHEADSAEITVRNEPPRILTQPRELTRIDGFQVRAEDPEGDPLTWSVSGGPDGLSISDLGVLRYQGSETEPGGTYTLTIRCDDPAGGWARIDVGITLSAGSKAAPK